MSNPVTTGCTFDIVSAVHRSGSERRVSHLDTQRIVEYVDQVLHVSKYLEIALCWAVDVGLE